MSVGRIRSVVLAIFVFVVLPLQLTSKPTLTVKNVTYIDILIFFCFSVLAFQSETRYQQYVDVLIPRTEYDDDVWRLIASYLNVKNLLPMREVSFHKQGIAKMTLMIRLNAGKITVADLCPLCVCVSAPTYVILLDLFHLKIAILKWKGYLPIVNE